MTTTYTTEPEIFKPFNEEYSVSNYGRVRKIKNEQIITPFKHSTSKVPYLRVNIKASNSTKRKTYYVHRLVASVFLDNINQYRYVKHINGNINDNSVSNLVYVQYQNSDAKVAPEFSDDDYSTASDEIVV